MQKKLFLGKLSRMLWRDLTKDICLAVAGAIFYYVATCRETGTRPAAPRQAGKGWRCLRVSRGPQPDSYNKRATHKYTETFLEKWEKRWVFSMVMNWRPWKIKVSKSKGRTQTVSRNSEFFVPWGLDSWLRTFSWIGVNVKYKNKECGNYRLQIEKLGGDSGRAV